MAITIKHGVNSLNLEDLGGQTVGEVRERVRDVLNLGEREEARLNGVPAGEDAVVNNGQTLEFVKVAGTKGG